MLFVIRHGQREDQLGGLLPNALGNDPRITEKGVLQARKTGHFILQLLSEAAAASSCHVSHLYIYSSPFIRCLMTARHLRAGLLNDPHLAHPLVSKIRITHGLFEELSCFKPSDHIFESLKVLTGHEEAKQALDPTELDLESFLHKF